MTHLPKKSKAHHASSEKKAKEGMNKKLKQRPVPPACVPAWAWLFAGVLVGILLSFLFYLYEIAPYHVPANAINQAETTTLPEKNPPPKSMSMATSGVDTKKIEATSPNPDTNKAKNSNFSFYEELPRSSELLSSGKTSPILSSDDQLITPVQTPGTYLLQVASYKDQTMAEELKNKLAAMGIPAYLEPVFINEDEWHRVRIGPFSDLTLLNQTKEQLAAENISAIVLKP